MVKTRKIHIQTFKNIFFCSLLVVHLIFYLSEKAKSILKCEKARIK